MPGIFNPKSFLKGEGNWWSFLRGKPTDLLSLLVSTLLIRLQMVGQKDH